MDSAVKEFSREHRLAILNGQIENWFTYHKPEGNDPERYQAIRDKAKELAKVIAENTPFCADQTVAIRKIREAVMVANQSIACKGA